MIPFLAPQIAALLFGSMLSAPLCSKLEEKLKNSTLSSVLKGFFQLGWYVVTCFGAALKLSGGLLAALCVSRWALAGAVLIFVGILLALFVTPSIAFIPFVGPKAAILNIALLAGGGLTLAYGYQTEYMPKQRTRSVVRVEKEITQLRTRFDKAPAKTSLEQIDRFLGTHLAKKWATPQVTKK